MSSGWTENGYFEWDWPPALLFGALAAVLGIAMLFGALLNIIIERAAFKPFRGRSRLAPLSATLGISFILFQAAIAQRFTPDVRGLSYLSFGLALYLTVLFRARCRNGRRVSRNGRRVSRT